MSEEVWPGMGERIGKRIKEMGHRSVEKFTKAFPDSDYSLSTVYKWIREEVAPSRANVLRLAADLECEPAYLFFGKPVPAVASRRKPVPIRGGSSGENPLPVLGSSGVHPDTHTIEAKYLKIKKSRDIMLSNGRTRVARRLLSDVAATARGTLRVAA